MPDLGDCEVECMEEFRALANDRGLLRTQDVCDFVDDLVECGEASVPLLIDALKDSEAQVRGFAARGLGRLELGRSDVVRALAAALYDEDLQVRQGAVVALNVLSPPPFEAGAALIGALNDTDPYVRGYAAEALDMLSDFRIPVVAPERGGSMIGHA